MRSQELPSVHLGLGRAAGSGPVTPTISVLLPVYNGAPYLREAVVSILEQTERDFELVLINDGSTDATHDIAQELCASDGRIRYLTQDNRGIVETLNRGLAFCRGEFIARMDADDLAHPRRFEKQLALLRSKPGLVICGSEARVFGDLEGRIRRPRSDRACRAWLLLGPCFQHPTVMFRRSIVDHGLRYRNFPHAEDYDFWVQVSELGKMENIAEPLLSYRVHGAQVTSTKAAAQKWMHSDIATAHLAKTGIAIDRAAFHEILWPEQSARSRWGILLSAFGLFLRMVVRGKFIPYLMAATAWHIVRHRRPAAAACDAAGEAASAPRDCSGPR